MVKPIPGPRQVFWAAGPGAQISGRAGALGQSSSVCATRATAQELAAPQPTVDDLLVVAEDHVKLRGCVNKLNEVQRHVVTMRMLEELNGAEVARELSLSPGHVVVLLHRAKAELQRCVMA